MALNGATSSSLNAMQHSAQLYSAKLNASISPGALGALGGAATGPDHLNNTSFGSAPLYVTGPFGNNS